MSDPDKTHQELREENLMLRKRIRELEQAETSLRERKAQFQSFVDNGPGIAWIKDEEGRYVYLNQTYERRFRVTLADWQGKTDFELWPMETAQAFLKNDLMVLQDGHALDIVEETKEPDGTVTYWWNFKFLITDGSGRRYVGGFGLDITGHKRVERELAVVLQRLHFHMENTPLAEVEFDKDFRVTYWSKQAENIFGWTAAEVIGRRIDQVRWVHEDDAQRVSDLMTDMLASRRTSNIHANRNYRKDGSVIRCEWYNSALLNESGDLISVRSQVLDITERIRAEEALRHREEQYRTLVDNMQDAVFRADLNGNLIFTSPSAARILGCASAEDMIGMNIRDDFYYDRNDAQKHLQILQEQGKLTSYRVILKRRDNGEPVIVSANTQFFRDRAGNIVGIEGVYRDITDRIRTDEALKKSEARYRLLHDSMRDAFARVDLDGLIREFNEMYVEMLGYEPEELKKMTYRDLTPEKWHALDAEVHEKQVFARGYSDIYEKEYRRKDGTIFPVELRTVLLRDDNGNPSGMWAIIRDITERKQVEKDREMLIVQLQQALKNVKTLSGLLPICSSCKKVRDDQGYWNQIEAYIRDHSQAEISHGICPDCLKKLYPDIYHRMYPDKKT